MKSYDNYAQLELLSTHSTDSLLYPPTAKPSQPNPVPAQPGKQIAIAARQLGAACVRFLTGDTSPTIRQRRDRSGELYFTVHDPISGANHRFSTEQDVRTWLEGRYNA